MEKHLVEHTLNSTPVIAIVANSVWNLSNYRRPIIKELLAEGCRVLLLAPEEEGFTQLEIDGARFIPLKNLHRKGLNPLNEYRLIKELVGIYRREGVIATLHYTIKPVIYGSLAARWLGLKNIVTLTGLGYGFLGSKGRTWFISALYRLALRRADVVFFHNQDDQHLFIDNRIIPATVAKVSPGSGVNVEYYSLVEYSHAVPGRFVFVGRLLSDKGIREFVTAAKIAHRANPDLQFQIVGAIDEGNPASISPAELARWNAEDSITLFGELSDVRPILSEASFVVLPSYREGCPKVLLEAAATGRPLIAFDVPGSREVVIDRETGWLVPAKDADALGATFLEAASTPFLEREDIGLAARSLAEEKFRDTYVTELYLKSLKSLLRT